ncbi:MAG: alpha/beta fold hydrolase [Legionellaceae bacterium]|nr:alpha/beta fold hydrolase [Legionellaceae bacterium]
MTKPTSWLWALLAFIILGTLLLYLMQRTLIYVPSKITPSRKNFQAEDMQRVSLVTQDKINLHAWYKPAAQSKPTLIIFHGNAGHIGRRMPLARALIQQGLGVFLLEYRGYGGNPGRPTEQGLYQDARAGITYLQHQNVSLHKLALYGESLGTGVAVKMASEYPSACALILQSPYTNMRALGQYHYPWIPIAPWDTFDSLSQIQSIHTPLLALHGTEDNIVPYQQGKALFKAANQPKQWVTLKNQNHHNLWTDDFIQTVSGFILKNCTKN